MLFIIPDFNKHVYYYFNNTRQIKIMTLKKAYKILKQHNKWRKGAGIEQITPTQLGIAIDIILSYLKDMVIDKKQ